MGSALPTDTRTAVKDVADQLLADGIRPSVKLVRERLGRGSDTTIAGALKDWWQELAERLFDQQSRPGVPEPVWEAVNGLWQAALDQAAKTFDADRAVLQRERDTATEDRGAALLGRDEAIDAGKRLEKEMEALQASVLEAGKAVAAEKARVDELRAQLEAANQKVQDADSRLATQAKEARGQLELAEHRYERLEQRSAREVDGARQERDTALHELAAERQRSREAEDQLRHDLSENRQHSARLEQRAVTAETALLARERELVAVRERAERVGELEAEVRRLVSAQEAALASKTAADDEIKRLQDELRTLRERLLIAEARLDDRNNSTKNDKS